MYHNVSFYSVHSRVNELRIQDLQAKYVLEGLSSKLVDTENPQNETI